jgi:hypothetical protein
MSSPKKKAPKHERRRIDVSRLNDTIRDNAPMAADDAYRDRPVVHAGHDVGEAPTQLTLADIDNAHCVWEEGDAKIYLGPAHAAGVQARERLVQTCVGAIINCTQSIPCHHRLDTHTIRYCQVPVRDHAGADILTYLPEATAFIEEHVQQGTSVLVHCQMGVSRSATVVMAYLMRYHNMTRDQAYIHLKQQRPSINPNEGFWQQLLIWQHQHKPTATTVTDSTSTAKIAATQESVSEPVVDRDWAQTSSTLYSACREQMEGSSDLSNACFDRCLALTAKDRKQTLEVCLDFVWGRGVSAQDVDWLTALCQFLAEQDIATKTTDNDNDRSVANNVSVQHQVLAILEDVNSDFGSQWSGEIFPEQMERMQQALRCCDRETTTSTTETSATTSSTHDD